MPLFCTDSEFAAMEEDARAVAGRADEYIHKLLRQVETHKARAEAATINAEQNCSLVEQKFMSVTSENAQLEAEKIQLLADVEQRSAELAEAKSQVQQLQLSLVKVEAQLERARFDAAEVLRGRQELQETIERKNSELDEKSISIQQYLDKIVHMTNERTDTEAKLREGMVEDVRLQATNARLMQEKELHERHNTWLKEELVSKTTALLQERSASADREAELQSKVLELEKENKEVKELAALTKERAKEKEAELERARQELKDIEADAVEQAEHLSSEISTVKRLAQLFKESSDEATQKASDLEGVIKAMEVYLKQQEEDASEKLRKEHEAREAIEKLANETKTRLEQELAKLKEEAARFPFGLHAIEHSVIPHDKAISPLSPDLAMILHAEKRAPPSLSTMASSSAVANALRHDGWKLTELYGRYEEAVDAWRHERHERLEAESYLDKVAEQVNAKLLVVEEEREEHKRLLTVYERMEKKLSEAAMAKALVDSTVTELRADLRSKAVEVQVLEAEIRNLNDQIATHLVDRHREEGRGTISLAGLGRTLVESSLNIRNFSDLLESNSTLRSRIQMLEKDLEEKSTELQAAYQVELERREKEQAEEIQKLLEELEKQRELMTAQKRSMDLYKRLYEEEVHQQVAPSTPPATAGESNADDYKMLLEAKEAELQKTREENQASMKELQQDLKKAREEASAARVDRAHAAAEYKYLKDQFDSMASDLENQHQEMEKVRKLNMELSHTITEYQRRIRENSQALQTAEENSRQCSIQVSVLEKEKELLALAEDRASKDIKSLSERFHHLQVTLESVQQAQSSKEASHIAERKRLEDDINRLQREWAEARKELEAERVHARKFLEARDRNAAEASAKLEAANKAADEAKREFHIAETRAEVLQARCEELQRSLQKAENLAVSAREEAKSGGEVDGARGEPDLKAQAEESRRALERAKEELAAVRGHLEQYKEIAQANEDVASQITAEYQKYRLLADETQKSTAIREEDLKNRITLLEDELAKRNAAFSEEALEKGKLLTQLEEELHAVQTSEASLQRELKAERERISTLRSDVESSQKKWREAQTNYERQVMLQGDTIREMSKVAARLAELEEQLPSATARAQIAEAALSREKVVLEAELESANAAKVTAEKALAETEAQNHILLERLEAAHFTSAEEAEKKAAASDGQAIEGQLASGAEAGSLQEVIRYLRRAKETSDVEVEALKQERRRLQREVEVATHEAREARVELQAVENKIRSSIHSQEEFEVLKSQISHMALLRESNTTLREESKRNFEDARHWEERARKAEAEIEPVQAALRRKDIEIAGKVEEVMAARKESERWRERSKQLLERYKAVDLEEYERKLAELASVEKKLKTTEEELSKVKAELNESSRKAQNLEEELAASKTQLAEVLADLEREKQAHASMKQTRDKINTAGLKYKKNLEATLKEKEQLVLDWNRERDQLSKQLDAAKASAADLGKRLEEERKKGEAAARQQVGSLQAGQARRDADNERRTAQQRAQALQKVLMSERERRQKEVKTLQDVLQRAQEARSKVMDELTQHREWMEKHKECTLPQQVLETMAGAEEANVSYVTLVNEVGQQLSAITTEKKAGDAAVSADVQGQSVDEAGSGAILTAPPAPFAPKRVSPPPANHAAAAERLAAQKKELAEQISKEADMLEKKAAEEREMQKVQKESLQAGGTGLEGVGDKEKGEEEAEKGLVAEGEGQQIDKEQSDIGTEQQAVNKVMQEKKAKAAEVAPVVVAELPSEGAPSVSSMDVDTVPEKTENMGERNSQDRQRQGAKRKAAADVEAERESKVEGGTSEKRVPEKHLAELRAHLLASMPSKSQRVAKIVEEQKEGGQKEKTIEEAKPPGRDEGTEPQEAQKDQGVLETEQVSKAPRPRRLIRPRLDSTHVDVPIEPSDITAERPPVVSEAEQSLPREKEEVAASIPAVSSGSLDMQQGLGAEREGEASPSIPPSILAITEAAEVTDLQPLHEGIDASRTEGAADMDSGEASRSGKRHRSPAPEVGRTGEVVMGGEGTSEPGVEAEVQDRDEHLTEAEEEQVGGVVGKRPRIMRPPLEEVLPSTEASQPALSLTLQEDEGGLLGIEVDGLVGTGEGGPEEGEIGDTLDVEIVNVTSATKFNESEQQELERGLMGEKGETAASAGNIVETGEQGADFAIIQNAGGLPEAEDASGAEALEEQKDVPDEHEEKEVDDTFLDVLQDELVEEGEMLMNTQEEEGEMRDDGEKAAELLLDEGLVSNDPAKESEPTPTSKEPANLAPRPPRVTRGSLAATLAAAEGAPGILGPSAAAGLRTRTAKLAAAGRGAEGLHGGEAGTVLSGRGRIVTISEQANETPALREQRRAQRFAEKPASPRVRGRGKGGPRAAALGARGSGRLVSLTGRGRGGQPSTPPAGVPEEEKDPAASAPPEQTPE